MYLFYFLASDLDGEKEPLLDVIGSYAHAVEISTGMEPPAYDSIHPQTIHISRPPSPPSATLISVYSEPIRIEYEESERFQGHLGYGRFLWTYYACCGYFNEEGMSFNDCRMFWTIMACFCCVLPIVFLFILCII